MSKLTLRDCSDRIFVLRSVRAAFLHAIGRVRPDVLFELKDVGVWHGDAPPKFAYWDEWADAHHIQANWILDVCRTLADQPERLATIDAHGADGAFLTDPLYESSWSVHQAERAAALFDATDRPWWVIFDAKFEDNGDVRSFTLRDVTDIRPPTPQPHRESKRAWDARWKRAGDQLWQQATDVAASHELVPAAVPTALDLHADWAARYYVNEEPPSAIAKTPGHERGGAAAVNVALKRLRPFLQLQRLRRPGQRTRTRQATK